MWSGKLLGMALCGLTLGTEVKDTLPLTLQSDQAFANVCLLGLNLDLVPPLEYCPLAQSYAKTLSKVLNVSQDSLKDACGTPGFVTLYKEVADISKLCPCQVDCAKIACPKDQRTKPNARVIFGTSEETCCDEMCSGFKCKDGFKLKPDAHDIVGGSKEVCCDKMCCDYECPDGWLPKAGREHIVGWDDSKCCVKTCENFVCPEYQQAKRDRHLIVGYDSVTCCNLVCSGFSSCPPGFKLRDNADDIVGFSPIACCTEAPTTPPPGLEKCSCLLKKTPCAEGTLAKPDVGERLALNSQQCCDATCSLFECGSGFKKKEDSEATVGFSRDVCCDKLCSEVLPPGIGWVPKKDFATRVGTSGCDCYDETCLTYTCPLYTTLKPEPKLIVGKDTDKCCDKLCGGYACPLNLKPRYDLFGTKGFSDEECCEVPKKDCTQIACPVTYRLKPNPHLIKKVTLDQEDCCDQLCTSVTCSADTRLVWHAALSIGNCEEDCCEKLCSGFQCPESSHLVPNAASLPGFSEVVCCVKDLKDCASISCPSSSVKKPNPHLIRGFDLTSDQCCDQLCAGFECNAGYSLKSIAATLVGSSNNVCCEKLCSDFSCPINTVKIENPEKVVGDDTCTCCRELCSGFQCPFYQAQKRDAADIVGFDPETCCDQLCAGYPCPPHRALVDPTKRAFSEDECCREEAPTTTPAPCASCAVCPWDWRCASVCSNFVKQTPCPFGTVPKENLHTVHGKSTDACCDKVCEGYTCKDKNSVKKAGCELIRGSDDATCCDKLCSGFTCSTGLRLRANSKELVAFDSKTCCEPVPLPPAKCGTFDCGTGWVLKDGVEHVLGHDKLECCDQLCSSFICPAPVFTLIEKPDKKKGSCVKDCCDKVCFGFDCPAGTKLVKAADKIRGFDADTCCEPALCSDFTCPAPFFTLIEKPDRVEACSVEECCDKVCFGFPCPLHKKLVPNADKIRGDDADTCCEPVKQACADLTCPANHRYKPNYLRIEFEASTEICCDRLCTTVECRRKDGLLLKEDAATTVGWTTDICCNKVCPCPPGTRAESSLDKTLHSCGACVKVCSGYTCPLYSIQKKNANDIVGDCPEKCCDEVCTGFTCKDSTPKLGSERIIGRDTETCCDKAPKEEYCDTFKCDAYNVGFAVYQLKPNAESLKHARPSLAYCCDPLCTNIVCPAPLYKPHPQQNTLIGTNPEQCCEKSCSLYPCPPGTVQLNGFLSDLGKGECCQKMCSSVSCPIYQTLVDNAQNVVGGTVEKCCQPVCSGFTCDDGLPKLLAATIVGNDFATCCDKVCTSFVCEHGYYLKSQACDIRGFSRDVCCSKAASTCIGGVLSATEAKAKSLDAVLKSAPHLDEQLQESTKESLKHCAGAIVDDLEVLGKTKQVVHKSTDFVAYSAKLPGMIAAAASSAMGWAAVPALLALVGLGVAAFRSKKRRSGELRLVDHTDAVDQFLDEDLEEYPSNTAPPVSVGPYSFRTVVQAHGEGFVPISPEAAD